MNYVSKENLDRIVQEMAKSVGRGDSSVLVDDTTPIGTIIAFMGIIAPEYYLICDGTIYSIVDYQDLADFIKTQFGSYNYFGGDGIDTFAVPDLKGEFLRMTGTNSHTNQGSGANVGVHQDGTGIPIINVYGTGNNINMLADSVDDLYTRNADSEYKVGNNTIKYINTSGTQSSTGSAGNFNTSRPTNTSVLYCIKYKTNTSINDGIQDLTEEEIDEIARAFTPQMQTSAVVLASAPAFYQRNKLFDTNKTTITVYPTWINIGDKGSILGTQKTIDITSAANWDDNTYISYSYRAGKDFYVYMCYTTAEPKIVLSHNKIAPSGYTTNNSRLIGGFHCLCVDVGTISGHTLSGYNAGDILPLSVWDLNFRANSDNDGMVYVKGINKWVDIYLSSWDSTNNILVSKYNETPVSGTSTPAMHGLLFAENYAKVNKILPFYDEFIVWAKGSTEGVNIAGSSMPSGTGGHNNTAGSRIISNYGIEDSFGVFLQWTRTLAEDYKGSTWNNNDYYLSGYAWQEKPVYNPTADSVKRGSCGGLLRRLIVGGYWGNSSNCGSRCVDATRFGSTLDASISSRGCSNAIIKQ